MIVTLTLNPAVDHTVVLEELVPGDTNRVRQGRIDPGGKGINVSRVLHELGCPSLAMGLAAGGLGRFIEHSLDELGIYEDFIHIRGQTRTNTTIVDLRHGTQTIISEPGPEASPRHLAQLQDRLKLRLHAGDWLVLAGSVPPRLEADVYAHFIKLAHGLGARTVLDADGEALALGLKACPYMAKQNRQELQRLAGQELADLAAVAQVAQAVHDRGVEVVVGSASEQGSVAISGQGRWRATPPRVEVVSAVGAGDSLMAGIVLILSRGGSLPEALRLGTAAAVATSLCPGTQLCRLGEVERLLPLVEVSPL